MKNEEGWGVLSRVLLHFQQQNQYGYEYQIIDHCRRLILTQEYPEDKQIVELLEESTARLSAW